MDPHGGGVDLGLAALVGHRERPDLTDLVAPELDPHRVVGGGREHVENASADSEFATAAHHVDTLVGHFGELGEQAVEVDLDTLGEVDGPGLAQTRRHRLHQRADGGHHHPQRITLGVGQAMQYRQAPADGVGARGEPFMRQCLPRRELHHRARVAEQLGQLGGQVVGLAAVGRDHQQRRSVVVGEGGDDKRPGRVGGGDVEFGLGVPLHQSGERLVATCDERLVHVRQA